MISRASPGRTPVPRLRQGYSPVSSAYRDGVQVAEDEWASVKFRPCLASRSNVRRQPGARPVAADVAEAEVVGVDQDDVRALGGGRGGRGDRQAEEQDGRVKHEA